MKNYIFTTVIPHFQLASMIIIPSCFILGVFLLILASDGYDENLSKLQKRISIIFFIIFLISSIFLIFTPDS